MGTVSRNDITCVSGKVNNLFSGCIEILGRLLTKRIITKTLNVIYKSYLIVCSHLLFLVHDYYKNKLDFSLKNSNCLKFVTTCMKIVFHRKYMESTFTWHLRAS